MPYSLVACPTCNHRRNYKGAKPSSDRKGEIRTFFCDLCDEEMSYLIQGSSIMLLPPENI